MGLSCKCNLSFTVKHTTYYSLSEQDSEDQFMFTAKMILRIVASSDEQKQLAAFQGQQQKSNDPQFKRAHLTPGKQ